MLGTVVNTVGVLLGSLLGLLFRRGVSQKLSDSITKGMGLCVLYIGISGALKGEKTLVAILSMVFGTIIGELLDLDLQINRLGQKLEAAVQPKNGAQGGIAQGFVTASSLFCVGAMAIVGSLQSGLVGNHEMLYAKTLLDTVLAVVLTASLGIGVMLSAVVVFAYQGSITLLAQWIAPYLTDTVIAEMTCVGSIIIIGLALNMIGLTKFKVMNYVPAIFLPILLCTFM